MTPLHAEPLDAEQAPWLGESDLSLDDFRAQVERDTALADYPHAEEVRGNVLVYSAQAMAGAVSRRALQAELIRALSDGPGVVVFTGAFDPGIVDRASDAFFAIIEAQRSVGSLRATTSARPAPTTASGTPRRSSRCMTPGLRRVLRQRRARARLPGMAGPAVSGDLTGQRRQSRRQGPSPHRDYHLGFVPEDHLAAYPRTSTAPRRR